MKQRQLTNGLAGFSVLAVALSFTPNPASLVLGPTPIDTLPFVISQPGSYCLVSNLSGNDGIEVTADNVDIDLAGFTLEGPGLGVAEVGVDAELCRNVKLRNGTLMGWGDRAVLAGPLTVLEDLSVLQCEFGASVGAASRLRDCSVTEVEITCVEMAENSRMESCHLETGSEEESCLVVDDRCALSNVTTSGGLFGIEGDQNLILKGCVVETFFECGIDVGSNSVVQDCQVKRSEGSDEAVGIRTGIQSRIEGCVVQSVSGVGIDAWHYTLVSDCVVGGSGHEGIRAQNGCLVRGCLVQQGNENGASDVGGIRTQSHTLVQDSMIANCGGAGILASAAGVTLRGNVLCQTTGPGLWIDSSTRVEGNLVQSSEQEGIRVEGAGNVVHKNLLQLNDVGLRVLEHANVIEGNRSIDNATADFDVLWGNAMGPTQRADAAILGSDPHLNFGHD